MNVIIFHLMLFCPARPFKESKLKTEIFMCNKIIENDLFCTSQDAVGMFRIALTSQIINSYKHSQILNFSNNFKMSGNC